MEKRQQWDNLTTKAFWLSFETIFIFGVPAFLAAFAGVRLDQHYHTGRIITVTLLLVAFVSSWALVLRNYKKLTKEADKLRNNHD